MWTHTSVAVGGVATWERVQLVVGPVRGEWRVRVWSRAGEKLADSVVSSSRRERARLVLEVDGVEWVAVRDGDCGCG